MLATHPAIWLATSPLPPVPSTVPIYKGTSTTTVDETTSTFTGIDIGVPHPRRMVILACYHGVAAAATATLNGTGHHDRTQSTSHEFSLFAFQVPCGTTAEVTVSATSSLRKAVSVFVAYPRYPLKLDSGTATANVGTDANIADLKLVEGGFLIYAGGQHATLGTFTTTWNANGTVTESVDAQLEAAGSYTMGYVSGVTLSSDTGDLNLAESTSGTKRLVAATWGPS